MRASLLIFLIYLSGCYELIRPHDKAVEYNESGLIALQQNDYDTAIEQFSNAVEVSPEFGGAWNNLGLAYFYKGDKENALKAMEKSVEIDYKLPEARNNLGVVLKELGDIERARSEFRMAIKLNKDYAEPHFHLGVIAGEEGKWSEARNFFEHALDIDPEFMEAGKNLGIVYLKLGMIEKGIRRLKITLENNKEDAELYDALGYALFLKGDFIEAFNHFSRAIEITPDNALYYLHRGITCIELSRIKDAENDFEKARTFDKNLKEPLILLSVLKLKEGDRKSAKEYLNKMKGSMILLENDILIKVYTRKLMGELEK